MKRTDCLPTEEQKRRMVAEAAFYRSRKHAPAEDPMKDWLAAEADVETHLAVSCGSTDIEPDLPAYHRIGREVRRVLERAENTFRSESLKKTLTRAVDEVRQRGHHIPETLTRASETVRQEMVGSIERLGNAWNNIKVKPGRLSADWRDKGTRALDRTSDSVHSWLKYWRSRGRH